MAVTTDQQLLQSNPRSSQLPTPGSGNHAARGGVECLYNFGGITINDRTLTERIEVYETTGFGGDVEIRDARESLPSDHGDIPLRLLYGGRTMTLRGSITAYSLNKLRDMKEAFDSAFNDIDLGEQLLTISSPMGQDVQIKALATAPTSTESQVDKRFKRDFLITLRASNPRLIAVVQRSLTIIGNLIANGQFEDDTSGWEGVPIGAGSAALVRTTTQSSVTTGKYALLASISNPTSADASGYVRVSAQRPVVAGEHYYMGVNVDGLNDAAHVTELGYFDQNGAWSTAGLAPADGGRTKAAYAPMRLGALLTVPAGVTSLRMALRRYVVAGNQAVLALDNAILASGSAPVAAGNGSLDNSGNFDSQSIIEIHGPWDIGLTIHNNTNDLVLKTSQAIPAGDVWTATASNKRIKDQAGNSKYNSLDVITRPMLLRKRATNFFTVDGSGANSNSQIIIKSNDTWM